MKHFAAVHHFVSDFRHVLDSAHSSRLQARGREQTELNAHLRYDIGEDDVRVAGRVTAPQQDTVRAMLLRAF